MTEENNKETDNDKLIEDQAREAIEATQSNKVLDIIENNHNNDTVVPEIELKPEDFVMSFHIPYEKTTADGKVHHLVDVIKGTKHARQNKLILTEYLTKYWQVEPKKVKPMLKKLGFWGKALSPDKLPEDMVTESEMKAENKD